MSDQSPSSDSTLSERTHDLVKVRQQALYSAAEMRGRAVVDFALLGLRSLLLLHGGALVGMLTFLGNFPELAQAGNALWCAFTAFIVGLLLALVAVALSYIAQQIFTLQDSAGADKVLFHYIEQPDEKLEVAELKHHKLGRALQVWAVIVSVLSVVALGVGAWAGVAALANAYAVTTEATIAPTAVPPQAEPQQPQPSP